MRDLLNGQFPNFYQLAGGITVDVALRYFFLVGIAWLLAYVLFRRRWFHRKIVASFPKPGEVRREIAYSLLSILIFGLTAAATLSAARHGWTQLYWPIAQRELSFPVLLQWWRQQNAKGHHVYAGLNDAEVGGKFSTDEITRQVRVSRILSVYSESDAVAGVQVRDDVLLWSAGSEEENCR